jgi:hypothetical protein
MDCDGRYLCRGILGIARTVKIRDRAYSAVKEDMKQQTVEQQYKQALAVLERVKNAKSLTVFARGVKKSYIWRLG